MIPQFTLKEKMLSLKNAGNVKKVQIKLLAFFVSMFFSLNISAQCPTDITVNADPDACSAYVALPNPVPPGSCSTLGPELVTSGDFESGNASWQDCGNSAEVHTGSYLTEYVYGGEINSSNHVAEIEHGDVPGTPHTLCQNITGFTIGATYRLTFKATRRIPFNPFLGPTPDLVGAIVTIAGTSTTVTRTNTVFEYTLEIIEL